MASRPATDPADPSSPDPRKEQSSQTDAPGGGLREVRPNAKLEWSGKGWQVVAPVQLSEKLAETLPDMARSASVVDIKDEYVEFLVARGLSEQFATANYDQTIAPQLTTFAAEGELDKSANASVSEPAEESVDAGNEAALKLPVKGDVPTFAERAEAGMPDLNPVEFYWAIWGDYHRAGILSLVDLNAYDGKLASAIRSHCRRHPDCSPEENLPPRQKDNLDRKAAEDPSGLAAKLLAERRERQARYMASKRLAARHHTPT